MTVELLPVPKTSPTRTIIIEYIYNKEKEYLHITQIMLFKIGRTFQFKCDVGISNIPF